MHYDSLGAFLARSLVPHTIVASDPLAPLAPWGQAAGIIIILFSLVSILLGIALAVALYLSLWWVREKAELLKKVRPIVNSVNTATEAALNGTPPDENENNVVRAVAAMPGQLRSVEQKIEEGSDKVARGVIEFRARTVMVKGMLKALFVPGLVRREQLDAAEEAKVELLAMKSPGYHVLVDEKAPPTSSTRLSAGYTGVVTASQLEAAPVQVSSSPPARP